MPLNPKPNTVIPALESICGRLAADGIESSDRVTDAEMAELAAYLGVTLVVRLSGRLDIAPDLRKEAIDKGYGAIGRLTDLRKLFERADAVESEAACYPVCQPDPAPTSAPVDALAGRA